MSLPSGHRDSKPEVSGRIPVGQLFFNNIFIFRKTTIYTEI